MEQTAPPIITTSNHRPALLGSDGFYAVARWSVLILLLATSSLLTTEPLWPPFRSMQPILLLIWGYALFSFFALLALLTKRLTGVVRAALVIDIIFITALTYFNETPHDLFYPLYIVPLVGAALQMHRSPGIALGMFAAIGYGAAFLVSYATDADRSVARDALGLLALGLRCAGLIFIPWLTSGLAERWSATNRRSVAVAEQKTQDALEEAGAYRDQMRALYEVAYSLSTNASYQNVLDATLTESRKLVPYTCGLVLLSTGRPDELFVAASQGLSDTDRSQTIRLGQGPISQALRETEPFVIDNLLVEPVFQSMASLVRCRSACAIPLRSGLRSFGVLIIAANRSDAFTQEQVGMLTALSNYALVALQNAQLIHDLRTERTKLLSKEEEVRHQLARDLHDGPAQALAAITMNVEFIKRLLDRDPSRVFNELDKLGALAKRTTHEVRTMLFELRPLALETQGLDVTLQQYFERFQGNGTQIILEADNLSANLDTKTEGTLFNIIQESVNNALKHARAEHIWVRVKQTPNALETTVQDDGRGFDLEKVKASYEKRGSFGLLNIEERAGLIGGIAEMHSAPGQGTTVRVIVPLYQ